MKIGDIPTRDQVFGERPYNFLALMDHWGQKIDTRVLYLGLEKKPTRRSMVGDSPARCGIVLEEKGLMVKLLELTARPMHSTP